MLWHLVFSFVSVSYSSCILGEYVTSNLTLSPATQASINKVVSTEAYSDSQMSNPSTLFTPHLNTSDFDFHERDQTDSIVFIYFDKFRPSSSGRISAFSILIGGATVSLLLQLISLIWYLSSLPYDHVDTFAVSHLASLLSGNILLIFGLQATGNFDICLCIAVFLHYCYLASTIWQVFLTINVYRRMRSLDSLKPFIPSFASWGVPGFWVGLSLAVNIKGYENHKYCWMSIEKGMLISYVVPISVLIMVNTLLALMSLKELLALRRTLKHAQLIQMNRDIRMSVLLLPSHAVLWFLTVLSAEEQNFPVFSWVASFGNIMMSILLLSSVYQDKREVCNPLSRMVQLLSQMRTLRSSRKRKQVKDKELKNLLEDQKTSKGKIAISLVEKTVQDECLNIVSEISPQSWTELGTWDSDLRYP